MPEIILPFSGKKKLHYFDFSKETSGICGSTEPCDIHVDENGSTCLRIGNHSLWVYGCSAKWIATINIHELVKDLVKYEEFKIRKFNIDRITIGSMVEAGFGAVPFSYSAVLILRENETERRRISIPAEVNNDKIRTYNIDVEMDPSSDIVIEVDESIRAATGYVILHVHDIVIEFSGEIEVPEENVKKGDLEIDVVDEEDNPISGATVRIIYGQIYKTGVTGPRGVVVFKNLIYGRYTVIIDAPGFKKYQTFLDLDQPYKVYKITLTRLPKKGIGIKEVLAIAAAVAAGAVGFISIKKLRGGSRK